MSRRSSSKQKLREFRRQSPRSGGATSSSNGQPPRATPENRRQYLRDYVNWLWPYRWGVVGIFLLAVITAGLDSLWPMLIKKMIDVLGTGKSHTLNLIGLGVATILLVRQATDSLRDYRTNVLNAKVIFTLRGFLFDKVLSLPLAALGEMKSGGIVSRLSGDVDNVSGLVQQAIISPTVAAIRIILGVGFVFWLSWRLAAAGLIVLPPMALISIIWIRGVRPIYRSIREDRSAIDGRITETFSGIRVVRSFRREPHEQHDYAIGHHTVIRKSLVAAWLELILSSAWGLLVPGASLLIVWYGGWLVMHQKATVGDIFALQIYAVLLIQPVWQMISSISATQRSLAAMERIFSVLEMKQDKPDAPDAVDAPANVEEFRFDNVSFEYNPGVTVIRDFSLDVKGGETVALVGPSGAGKTSLTDLVARFHDPTRGAILLNGIDLRKIKLKSFRSLLAIVQQDTFLFDGTVRENISYGRRGATEAQIIDAAARANAHEFITRMPQGYDTIIGERGFKLSGGQRQRLSIARAILADPQILILDEATSNLDTESEQLIQASLNELLKGRTTFIIAHRLSTIAHADRIVVLQEGRLVETGTHEQLMQNGRLYPEMVQRQQKSLAAMMPLAQFLRASDADGEETGG